MRDEKGFDFKVLCVAIGDAHQQHIERLDQVRPHRLVEIEHFFQTYKALEDKTVDVVGWREREPALEVLRDRPRDLAARGRRAGRIRREPGPAAAAATRTPACPGDACSSPCRCPTTPPTAVAAVVDEVRAAGAARRRARRPLGPPRRACT